MIRRFCGWWTYMNGPRSDVLGGLFGLFILAALFLLMAQRWWLAFGAFAFGGAAFMADVITDVLVINRFYRLIGAMDKEEHIKRSE